MTKLFLLILVFYLIAELTEQALFNSSEPRVRKFKSKPLAKSLNFKLPCKRTTCRFGACENLIINSNLTYTCHCPKGVTGSACATLDSERLPCSHNPCLAGGKCYNYLDDYYCDCPKGKSGKNCSQTTDKWTDPCKSSPCGSKSICFTASNGFWCFCENGKNGPNCNDIEPASSNKTTVSKKMPGEGGICERNVCKNKSKCLAMNNSIICVCKPGFFGPRCENSYNSTSTLNLFIKNN